MMAEGWAGGVDGPNACGRQGVRRLRSLDAAWRGDSVAGQLVAIVSSQEDLSLTVLLQGSRGTAPVAEARQLAMYLIHVILGRSYTEIGRLFGRDRTTVAHACAIIEDRRDEPDFERRVAALEARLGALVDADDEGDARPMRRSGTHG
ncbi:MAG: helix-turn-helix domain-containing protein [Devosia sp.]